MFPRSGTVPLTKDSRTRVSFRRGAIRANEFPSNSTTLPGVTRWMWPFCAARYLALTWRDKRTEESIRNLPPIPHHTKYIRQETSDHGGYKFQSANNRILTLRNTCILRLFDNSCIVYCHTNISNLSLDTSLTDLMHFRNGDNQKDLFTRPETFAPRHTHAPA